MSGAYLPTEFESRRGYSDVLAAYVRLARPFTLLAPSLGMVSGGIVAWFAVPQERLVDARVLTANLILGAVAAALRHAASNAILLKKYGCVPSLWERA